MAFGIADREDGLRPLAKPSDPQIRATGKDCRHGVPTQAFQSGQRRHPRMPHAGDRPVHRRGANFEAGEQRVLGQAAQNVLGGFWIHCALPADGRILASAFDVAPKSHRLAAAHQTQRHDFVRIIVGQAFVHDAVGLENRETGHPGDGLIHDDAHGLAAVRQLVDPLGQKSRRNGVGRVNQPLIVKSSADTAPALAGAIVVHRMVRHVKGETSDRIVLCGLADFLFEFCRQPGPIRRG